MVTYPQHLDAEPAGNMPRPQENLPNRSDKPLKLFSLSSEYPNPAEPGKALFIQARLQAMSRLTHISIVAPVALLDYANPYGRLLGFREIPSRRFDAGIEVMHPRWIYPPRGGVLNAFCMFLRLLPLVKELKHKGLCDVIDAHFAHPEGIAAALLGSVLNLPFTVTMRGSEFLHYKFKLRRFWMSWALRRAALVITVSEGLRDLAVELGANPANTAVIPNGVNSAMFHPRDRARCRRELGVPDSTCIILAAGNLAPIKCHEKIVRALRGVIDDGIPAQLWLAGGIGRSGRHEAVIRAEIAACGLEKNVRFLGEVPQSALAEYMVAADVFCLASSREGWPNVVNEALACGTPVVATDVGAVRRMLPSKDYGVVVPPGDVPALKGGLSEALQRDWNRTSIATWASSRSWDHVGAEVVRAISSHVDALRACQVIINADDFGMNERVNDAICDAISQGKITSVTILANAPCLDEALKNIPHFPQCSFGVHLNLTEFEPLTAGARGKLLVDESGQMTRHITTLFPTPALMEAIYEEWCAQIAHLISRGVDISHIDSHNHVHTVPFVFPALKAVQKHFGIRKVRITKNIYSVDQPCTTGLAIKKRSYNIALRKLYPTRTTGGFSEMSTFCKEANLHPLRHRSVELMVHPGAPNNEAETELLYSDWERDLPFPVAKINYHRI
jgi:predicted glycoside hydrolase/deacetylase ChbG (UPF0249 family)/glycosyltransferase involved in cell wall biosynthesis